MQSTTSAGVTGLPRVADQRSAMAANAAAASP
jgi:hypothetical protein